MNKSRQEANRELIEMISHIVEYYPDIRFAQILSNLSILDYNTGKFYEESHITLKNAKEVVDNYEGV